MLIDSGAANGKIGIRSVADQENLANTIREQRRIEAIYQNGRD